MSRPILLSWSGGKDCLMALAALRADPAWQVVGLLTTVTAHYERRVSMHGIRNDVLRAQAAALGLPLVEAVMAPPADDAAYEHAQAAALDAAARRWPGVRHCAYGDLLLADVRAWRENLLAKYGWRGVFPLWRQDTAATAQHFVAAGHRAVVVCVDTTQLDGRFCGREFDDAFVAELPASVDACGENGEFHTLSYGGPLFAPALALTRGVRVLRDDRFQYTDFELATAAH